MYHAFSPTRGSFEDVMATVMVEKSHLKMEARGQPYNFPWLRKMQ